MLGMKSKDGQKLEVVNDNDEVIGTETRERIHRDGLLHREIHLWFYTPDRMIVFQHRAKDKDTYPDKLDATVGGHVEIGDSYESTVIKEVGEETGLSLKPGDAVFLIKVRTKLSDPVTGKTNNAFQSEYAYRFTGRIEDLKIEEGKALGFEAWPISKLLNCGASMTEEEKGRFIPVFLSKDYVPVFDKIDGLIR